MLKYSAGGLAVAAAAFLYLNRDSKREVLGVGEGQNINKLKGSKHKSDGTLASLADYQQVYNAVASKLDKVRI